VTGWSWRRRGRFDFERILQPEDSEDDIVPEYVEVPGDDGPLVCDVDDAFVNLAFGHWKSTSDVRI